jgi:hypothetical protein
MQTTQTAEELLRIGETCLPGLSIEEMTGLVSSEQLNRRSALER